MISELKLGKRAIYGRSLAGIFTSLHIPWLDCLLDIGFAPRRATGVAHLFLSHAHLDHLGGLPSFLGMRGLGGSRRLLKLYHPEEVTVDLKAALDAFSKVHRWPLEVNLQPMAPGDELPLRRDLKVRAFRTLHPVPSLGYLFFNEVNKLKPELQGQPSEKIRSARLAGHDIFDVSARLELAYATDTRAEVLERHPEIGQAKTLIMECSFLDERKPVKSALDGGHVHLDRLLPYAELIQSEALVLMHFSQIYRPTEIPKLLQARLPPGLAARTHPLLPEGGRWWA
ncbi:MBL fold metallo-hydrolase [Myxococcota bacterium]|nr:MBL fold metallo-hydrolase [Myxococcota bacterium]